MPATDPTAAKPAPAIAFIGAGSLGFTATLIHDLMCVPELRGCRIAFHDIDARNLERVTRLCQRDLDANGVDVRIRATTYRREALRDADHVFCVVRVGGLAAFRSDIEIPLAYGVDQCVGDTLCAGGVMYGQRGIAFMLGLCADIRAVAAPGCLLFNYSNPMAMLTWAANAHGGVRCYGLCHGIEQGHNQIASALDIPRHELDTFAAGINHQTWFLRIAHRGRDLTGALLAAFERHETYRQREKVRIDVLRRFGFYSTESNGHLSEYLAWYRKRPAAMADWIDASAGRWIDGETAGYLRYTTGKRDDFEREYDDSLAKPANTFDPAKRSQERGSYIIEALTTGRVLRGYVNVVNRHAIANLPSDAVVEVPAYMDRLGIHVPAVGDLPAGCAAICSASISVQRLAVAAAVSGDDALLRQAMLLDPLVGAVCDPREVWRMVDEMLVAQEAWLPQYARAIAAAKERLAQAPGRATAISA